MALSPANNDDDDDDVNLRISFRFRGMLTSRVWFGNSTNCWLPVPVFPAKKILSGLDYTSFFMTATNN